MTAEAIRHGEGPYQGNGGIRLYRQWWRPEGPPRAVLVNLHGLGDHSGLYPMLVERLVSRGLTVHSPDLRGNGRSAGRRGHVRAWSDYREDLRLLLHLVGSEEGDRPLFLMGNSLGGLIVLDYALYHPRGLRGVVASAPPLGGLGVPAPLMALGRVVSRLLPGFRLRTGMDLSGLARDPAVTAEVLADPLFHRLGSARLSTEITATIRRVHTLAPSFPVPLLILHGSADRMVTPEGSRRFIGKVGHPDKQLREYPGAYHALFADIGAGEVLGDLEHWIEARI
jgi:alpha-beta hydrolase superfamily lysophospholipase